jgi:hypothetical protein
MGWDGIWDRMLGRDWDWDGILRDGMGVEFCVSAQVIEQIIVFVGARYKHVEIHEENGSTNIPFSARISVDP